MVTLKKLEDVSQILPHGPPPGAGVAGVRAGSGFGPGVSSATETRLGHLRFLVWPQLVHEWFSFFSLDTTEGMLDSTECWGVSHGKYISDLFISPCLHHNFVSRRTNKGVG